MNVVSLQIYLILWRKNDLWLAVDLEHFWYKGECLPFCTAPNITRKLLLVSFPCGHKQPGIQGQGSWSYSFTQKVHSSRMERGTSQVMFVATGEGHEDQLSYSVRCLCHPTEQVWWDVCSMLCLPMAQSDQGLLLVFAEAEELYLPY